MYVILTKEQNFGKISKDFEMLFNRKKSLKHLNNGVF